MYITKTNPKYINKVERENLRESDVQLLYFSISTDHEDWIIDILYFRIRPSREEVPLTQKDACNS